MKYMLLLAVVVLVVALSPSLREPFLAMLPALEDLPLEWVPGLDLGTGRRSFTASEGSTFLTRQRTVRKGADDAPLLRPGTKVLFHLSLQAPEHPFETYYDSKSHRTDPLSAVLGKEEVIPAVEEALQQMKANERSVFLASASKCYGVRGFSPWNLPPNMNLRLELEVVKAEEVPPS